MNKHQANTVFLNSYWLNKHGEAKNRKNDVIEDIFQELCASATVTYELVSARLDGLTKLELYGGCIQDGTPTPSSPISITTNKGTMIFGALGNNLLNSNETVIIVGKYINNSGESTNSAANCYFDYFIPVKPNTAYTLSTDISLNYSNFMEYDADYNFVKRTLYGSGASSPAGKDTTHTMGETTAFVKVGSNISGATLTIDFVKGISWMLNEGETVLPYEQYVQGTKLNGNDTVRIGSRNLNEGVLAYNGYTSTGGISSSTTFCGSLHKIKVKEGQKYTVSFGDLPDGASGVFVNTWKTDGSWNMRQAISSNGKLTYTIPEGIGEVNFTLYKTGGISIGEDSWLQVEYGTEATEYQPYSLHGIVEAELLLSVGDYVDVQDMATGVVTRRVGIKIFDGSERISLSSGTFNFGINDKLKTGSTLWCSHYPYTSASASLANDKTIKSYSSVNIGFKDADYTTTDEFEAFLLNEYKKGTPVIVMYPLADETTEKGATIQNKSDNSQVLRSCEINSLEMNICYMQKVEKPTGSKLIKFYLQRCYLRGGELQEYTAEDGMTWVEFCRSDYNTDGWYAYNQDEGEADDYVETFYNVDDNGGWNSYEEWGWITSSQDIWVDGRETYKDKIIADHVYYEKWDSYGVSGGGGV